MKILKLLTLAIALCSTLGSSAQQIVAHRGHHSAKGAVENSIAALRAASDAGIDVVECDLNMTTDGEVVVINGPWLGERGDADRLNIQRSDLATIRSKQLANGEKVPTLDEYLSEFSTLSNIRLVIEIKEHSTPQDETKIVRKVLDAVKSHRLGDRVEYTSLREHICNELVRLAPADTRVSYLNGTLTPEYANGLGYTGISYQLDVLKRIPRWIKEAHRLNMTVNVWTVNQPSDIMWCIANGVDYITTDRPDLVKEQLGK